MSVIALLLEGADLLCNPIAIRDAAGPSHPRGLFQRVVADFPDFRSGRFQAIGKINISPQPLDLVGGFVIDIRPDTRSWMLIRQSAQPLHDVAHLWLLLV